MIADLWYHPHIYIPSDTSTLAEGAHGGDGGASLHTLGRSDMSEARVGDLAESRDYQRLSDLFARLGVRENPFGLREPDLEDPVRQATYFVPPPMFNEVLGRAEAPESVLVLAPRGAGKTTFRQQIARRCRDQLPPVTGVLDVTYADFSRPLAAAQAAGRAVTVRDHVEEIVRCAVERLIETINEVSVRKFAMLPGGKLATLSAYLRTYNWLLADDNRGDAIHALFERLAAGRGEQLGVDTSQLLHGDAAAIMAQLSPGLAPVAELLLKLHAQPARVLDTASYLGRLRDLLALLVALDYQAMYVLVDRLDEGEGLHDPDAAITFIAPLITDLKLLEEPHLACKFFLPDYLSDRLVAAGLRRKRLPTYHLKWSDDEILILLQRRLRGVSRYSSLREFCAPALRARLPEPPLPDHPQVGYIDLALVAAARELPRDLILRCRALFAHFAARGGDDYLTEADLAAALAAPLDPDNPPGLPDDPSLAVAPPAAPATAAVPTPPPWSHWLPRPRTLSHCGGWRLMATNTSGAMARNCRKIPAPSNSASSNICARTAIGSAKRRIFCAPSGATVPTPTLPITRPSTACARRWNTTQPTRSSSLPWRAAASAWKMDRWAVGTLPERALTGSCGVHRRGGNNGIDARAD
jgi:hypothetical protein